MSPMALTFLMVLLPDPVVCVFMCRIRWVDTNSTGPKSPEGKARSAMRGFKGGTRESLRELARMLRDQVEYLKQIKQ
jgi:hypothetical protein